MIDYKEIDLDKDMPILKEQLKSNDLLRFTYLITVRDRINDEYYKVEDNFAVKNAYRKETDDMSRHLQNADIKISENEIILHYDYQGAKKYKVELTSSEYDSYGKRDNFKKWLEQKIITVIDKMICYWND